MDFVTKAVAEGLVERKSDKAADREGDDEDTLVEEVYEEEVEAGYDEEEGDEEGVAEADIAEDEAEDEPVVIPAPKAKKVSAQDLTKIEGIGPKLASVLQEAGIVTYAQLAKADEGQLEQILEASDPRLLRLARPASWPEQAALAAAGEWEALEALQGEL